MNDSSARPSRRNWLKETTTLTTAAAVAASGLRNVHAGSDEALRVVLIGCGGRGGGAAAADAREGARGSAELAGRGGGGVGVRCIDARVRILSEGVVKRRAERSGASGEG